MNDGSLGGHPTGQASGNRVALGSSDLVVGRLAYGTWRAASGSDGPASVDELVARLRTAIDLGMTLIDTADVYGLDGPGFGAVESLLGEAFGNDPTLRCECVLATKGGIVPPTPYDSSHAGLVAAAHASLGRLNVEVIDLYQVHRPDLLAHPAEVAGALDELVDRGDVRWYGVSNYSVEQTRALQAHARRPLVTTQPEFHLLQRTPLTDGVLDLAMETRTTPLAWSPLAGGRLVAPGPDVDAGLVAVIDRMAASRGIGRDAIVLAWLMAHPSGVVPIVGTNNLERIRSAATALDVELTRAEWYELLVAAQGAPMP